MKKINEEGIERDTPFDGGNLEGQKEMFDIDQLIQESDVLEALEETCVALQHKGIVFANEMTERIRRQAISAIVLAAKNAHVDLQASLPEGYNSVSEFVEETDLFRGVVEQVAEAVIEGMNTNWYYPLDTY